ncbi:MAG: cation:proton antiporter, partial [Gammaproteobacteria bacterium]|nr:cation:proton antiporter [Gammaproteobacteria bacterium]
MEHDPLLTTLVLLGTVVAAVVLFRRLALPPILAYLVVGTLIGPNVLGWFDNSETIELLGEIGVAFLLFTIGLEFSIPRFMGMRRILIGLGGAQVLAGTLTGGLIAWWSGLSLPLAFVIGGALSMSSTAIVIKQLTDQLELSSRHGNLSLGILLFQDLAAVPFLAVIPILADGGGGSIEAALGFALLKAVLVLGVLVAVGRYALRPIFHEVARAHSVELFTLSVLLVSLLAAWLTHKMGLSFALGAFVAGMMLSETEYRHLIERELRPFTDVLLGLFFIPVGTRLDPSVLPETWPWV